VQTQQGMDLAHHLNRRLVVNDATVLDERDGAPHMAREYSQEVRHVHSLEVLWLESEVQAQMLALGRHREGPQSEDSVMRLVVRGD
jgi:hypothetical protein